MEKSWTKGAWIRYEIRHRNESIGKREFALIRQNQIYTY